MTNNNYIPTNIQGLAFDPRSGAILNVDNNKLEEYKRTVKHRQEIQNNFERLNKLENEMSEIKNILQLIAEKVSK
jgi:hypothetical protein